MLTFDSTKTMKLVLYLQMLERLWLAWELLMWSWAVLKFGVTKVVLLLSVYGIERGSIFPVASGSKNALGQLCAFFQTLIYTGNLFSCHTGKSEQKTLSEIAFLVSNNWRPWQVGLFIREGITAACLWGILPFGCHGTWEEKSHCYATNAWFSAP